MQVLLEEPLSVNVPTTFSDLEEWLAIQGTKVSFPHVFQEERESKREREREREGGWGEQV